MKKRFESNVVQKFCNETHNTMILSFARITSIDLSDVLISKMALLLLNLPYFC